ncbi:hypothetical protein H2200_008887 [Cladophialophora chaetospira]|uniref:DUF6594 domain-containing protein n=1 Tax=Cladophialophora chaetospira TaxID=386627 RepID=A0AA39CG53_9EURO|nr:hypothetical protein H2200_008887 [Cladophialophora chaetospira]
MRPGLSFAQDAAQENHLLGNFIPAALRPIPKFVPKRRSSRPQSAAPVVPVIDLEFPERIFETGKSELLYSIPNRATGKFKCVVNLATLQRMNLHVLQKEILDEVASALTLGRLEMASSRRTRRLMQEYCDALRNWDLMEEKRTLDFEKDPFKLVTSKALDCKMMEEAEIALPLHREDLRNLRRPSDSAEPQLPGDSRAGILQEREAQAIVKRFGVALVGGMALLIPMIIMVLHKDLLTTLLVVSVSVILFAVLVAIYSHQSSVDILTLTAAYAAVLVVFVGSSS